MLGLTIQHRSYGVWDFVRSHVSESVQICVIAANRQALSYCTAFFERYNKQRFLVQILKVELPKPAATA
jgi:hypothetical protein